jgi:hypothetical protein
MVVIFLLPFYRDDKTKIFVGCIDIANNIYFLKQIFGDDCITVIKKRHRFYNYSYDITFPRVAQSNFLSELLTQIIAPYIFIYCYSKCHIFIYFWSESLLLDRNFEFSILKSHNKLIINRYVGCDIRHWIPALEELDRKDVFHVCSLCRYAFSDQCNEEQKKRIAQESDLYADIVYSDAGMPSFINKKYKITRVPLNLENYKYSFVTADIPQIVHAPSDPILKGTSIIRLALRRLEKEKYTFRYNEIVGQSNKRVIKALIDSHIVIDQLAGCGTGLFSLEAMACGNVVLGGANPELNPVVGRDCPVIKVNPLNIYERLKWVLDHPECWEKLAMSGRKYLEKYHDKDIVALQWKRDISEILDR